MSKDVRILWGINKPDGSPVAKAPTFGSDFWTHVAGQHGFSEAHHDAAIRGREELEQDLQRQGVRPEHSAHEVVRIVITTTVDRQGEWTHEFDGSDVAGGVPE